MFLILDHSRISSGYSNIEQSAYPCRVETASPYVTVDKTPGTS